VTVLGSTAPYGQIADDYGSDARLSDITVQKSIERHKKNSFRLPAMNCVPPITAIQGFAEILQMQASREQKLSSQGLRAITCINEQKPELDTSIEEMLDIPALKMRSYNLILPPPRPGKYLLM